MNIFRINLWVIFFTFSFPCLFFAGTPIVLSILYFIFFLLFFLQISREVSENINFRSKVECIVLLAIYASYPLSNFIEKEIIFNETSKQIFSIIYFGIFIDLSNTTTKFLFENKKSQLTFFKRIVVFFCLLVPPIGIYYLSALYRKRTPLLQV